MHYKQKQTLKDPAQGDGVYRGDLKYGRCHGTEPKSNHDYPADPQDGQASNKAVFELPPGHKRDPALWAKGYKGPKIKSNPPQVADQLLKATVEHRHGLITCTSRLVVGGSLIKSRQ